MLESGGGFGEEQSIGLTLYTDAYVIRGSVRTRQRRVTDILNDAERDFLVLNDTLLDEYGSRSLVVRSEYAQVNLASVLFAVAETPVQPAPELRTPKVAEQAIISIPPFRITGQIHLLAGRSLREGLEELSGRFLPVTEATYWSDTIGEARQTAPMVAFNRSRAQILAPYQEVDPWAGLDRSGGEGTRPAGEPGRTPDALGDVPTHAASTSAPTGSQDPWGPRPAPAGPAAPGTAPRPAMPAAPTAPTPRPSSAPATPGLPPTPAAPTAPGTAAGHQRDMRTRLAEGSKPGNPWGGAGGDPWTLRRPREGESPR